jgi:hypothetical protein
VSVLVRLIALLLTVMMMTGGVEQALGSPDSMTAIDDASELDAPVVPVQAAVAAIHHREPFGPSAAAPPEVGRIHAAFVFRPPRPVASR